MRSSVRALTAADHFGSLMPEYPAFLSYTLFSRDS
jgi:hypothetical protein